MKKVYMVFSADYIHGGHMDIIQKAASIGELIVGVLTDRVVAEYKRYPLLPYEERARIIAGIKGVSRVIPQRELRYLNNLAEIKPDVVVHGDDWRTGYQMKIRQEVLEFLKLNGGELIEFPYSSKPEYEQIEGTMRKQAGIPDFRRKKLEKLLEMKNCVRVIEAHNGISGLIAEETRVYEDGKTKQFDAIWVSSLCDSTAKGRPDIELVDMTSRIRTIDDIMQVTTKPIILDCDTGGLTEHFVYSIETLERIGVSAVIIEDKIGLKRNSLFGNEVAQEQDSAENFSDKIRAGKRALLTDEFMLIARIESLILEKGMDDALLRAHAYVDAGADGIMIHSRQKSPDEVFEFCGKFRKVNDRTPLVAVPTSYNEVTEDKLEEHGVNIIIYANQLIRSAFPAMKNAAELILRYSRAKEADDVCMPIDEILCIIPEKHCGA